MSNLPDNTFKPRGFFLIGQIFLGIKCPVKCCFEGRRDNCLSAHWNRHPAVISNFV